MALIKNRRHGPDAIVRMITVFSVISWLVIGIALVIFQMAHPMSGSFDSVRREMVSYKYGILAAKVLLFVNVLICVWGLVMNVMRNNRKGDHFHFSLVVSALVSLAGFVLMLIFL